MIRLPWKLGTIIRDSIDDYRRKNNIPEPEEVKALGVHAKRDTFLEEELELVRNIVIDKDIVEYIDLFPNITSITMDGLKELDAFDIKAIIEKHPNLEELTIKGQEQLQYLDVGNLSKLKKLDLVSNRSLSRVVGLDNINNLEQLTFYDNIVYKKEQELCEIALNLSQKGTKCNMDVLYMPTFEKIGANSLGNFNWCESVGLGIYGEEIKYTTDELLPAYNKAKEIVSKYISQNDTDKEKYAILYQWICNNIKYSDDSLKTGDINGTVNGLINGSCVCEGYTKSMQMLLKLCDIPSFDVTCIAEEQEKIMPQINIDGKKKMHRGDHSIIKVNVDGLCYYSDITWDADRYQNGRNRQYFLLSKNDMQQDHKLVGEDKVFSAMKSVSQEEFEYLMQVANSRIRTANETKNSNKLTRPYIRQEVKDRVMGNFFQRQEKFPDVTPNKRQKVVSIHEGNYLFEEEEQEHGMSM